MYYIAAYNKFLERYTFPHFVHSKNGVLKIYHGVGPQVRRIPANRHRYHYHFHRCRVCGRNRGCGRRRRRATAVVIVFVFATDLVWLLVDFVLVWNIMALIWFDLGFCSIF